MNLGIFIGFLEIVMLSSNWQVQYQSRWDDTSPIISVNQTNPTNPPTPPTHPPTRASIFEPLLDYLGSWNLAQKLYTTKVGQLANLLLTS